MSVVGVHGPVDPCQWMSACAERMDAMASASARQTWIVEQLPLRPADHVVELGCGHGVAATAICERLTSGRYLGLDRSATMIAAATRRNEAHVAEGRARFVTTSVADADIEGGVEWALAIHFPPIDRGDPSAELAALRPHLVDGGALAVGFQPLDPAVMPASVDRLAGVLGAGGFAIQDVHRGEPDGRPTAVVVARLRPR